MDKNLALETLKSFVENTDNVIAKDVILALHPELSESEDERIRKELWEYFHDLQLSSDRDFSPSFTIDDILAYLERQKENSKTVYSISADCVSDVKWADTIITRAIVALSDDVDYNRDEPCKYRREIDDLKKLRDVLCGQKEQKPAEKPDLVVQLKEHLANTPKEQLEKEWKELEPWGNIGPTVHEFLYGKPVEWSEEDELMRNAVLNTLERIGDYGTIGMQKDWLKSLPSRFNPQPHWKPSEQEKGALRTAIYILTEERNFPLAAEHLQNILNAFEGKESRKDWRPSQEQIDILDKVYHYLWADRNATADMQDGLGDFIDELKSL